jgi:hypothetical protein
MQDEQSTVSSPAVSTSAPTNTSEFNRRTARERVSTLVCDYLREYMKSKQIASKVPWSLSHFPSTQTRSLTQTGGLQAPCAQSHAQVHCPERRRAVCCQRRHERSSACACQGLLCGRHGLSAQASQANIAARLRVVLAEYFCLVEKERGIPWQPFFDCAPRHRTHTLTAHPANPHTPLTSMGDQRMSLRLCMSQYLLHRLTACVWCVADDSKRRASVQRFERKTSKQLKSVRALMNMSFQVYVQKFVTVFGF